MTAVPLFDAARRVCEQGSWALTNLKLQKILYLAQMAYMGENDGARLIDADFQAWDHGPVEPALYQRVKIFGSRPITEDIFFLATSDVSDAAIGDFLMGVQPIPERYAALEALLREFIAQTPQTITSSRALAERMAGKAVLIKDVLANSLMQDKDGTSELMDQYNAFKEHLIHDISIKDFADIYAETVKREAIDEACILRRNRKDWLRTKELARQLAGF